MSHASSRHTTGLKGVVASALRDILLNNAAELISVIHHAGPAIRTEISVVDDLNLQLVVRTPHGSRYFNIKISEML